MVLEPGYRSLISDKAGGPPRNCLADELIAAQTEGERSPGLPSQNNDEPMQLRVTCRDVSIAGRRWVEYVVEQRHQHGWTVLATFRDMNQCCAFLLARPGAQIEFISE
jgi:hypothetical protein